MNIRVTGAGYAEVNGLYVRRSRQQVPVGFAATCQRMGWPARAMWEKLAAPTVDWWFASESNDSYIYLHADGQWWIDGPDGAGIYIADQQVPQAGGGDVQVEGSTNQDCHTACSDANKSLPSHHFPPLQGWKPLIPNAAPLPIVEAILVGEGKM